MKMTVIKQCGVCSKEFSPCNRCLKQSNNRDILQWRRVVCCPEHFSFYLPIINYVRRNIDKQTAKKELQTAVKYYGEPDFNNNVRGIVNEIMAEPVTEPKFEAEAWIAYEESVGNATDHTVDITETDDVNELADSETKAEKHKRKK